MKKRLELLQIFRGIAAMLVVIYHLSRSLQNYFQTSLFGDVFSFGFVGVDFFFVLSGFIITYVHFNDLEKGTNIIPFLKKRFIRIYPIYWVIASVKLLSLYLTNFKSNHFNFNLNFQSSDSWYYLVKCYLLLPTQSGFFLGVAWSLVYEVFFYTVFFIAMLMGFKKAKYFILVWTAIILIKIFLSPFYSFPDLLIINRRVIEFLSGCMVAYLFLKSYRIRNDVWVLLTSAVIITIYFTLSTWAWKPYSILLLALINGLLVYKIVDTDMRKEKKYPKLFSLIGEASYSIYLSHVLFLGVLLRIFRMVIVEVEMNNPFVIQCVGITIFIVTVTGGVFIYRMIELPLITYLNKKMLHKKQVVENNTSILRSLYESILNISLRKYGRRLLK